MREIAEKIGPNLSLEDFTALLGDKISKENFKKQGQLPHDLYVVLHPGLTSKGVRAVIEYWTTLGSKGNDIPAGQGLVADPAEPALKKEKDNETVARFVTSTGGGKDAPSEPELYQAMKDALVRRGRLNTPEDIRSFCKTWLGDALLGLELSGGVELDPRPGFGITRTLVVSLTVKDPQNQSWEQTCRELEIAIAESSLMGIPCRVRIKNIEIEVP